MTTHPDTPVRLTEMVSCAGCAAKLGPARLRAAVGGLLDGMTPDPNVLVGFGLLDDAGVYKLSDDLALVQTVDFFTPVVDDPVLFGEIAAANALSDVYAMGGTPRTALNVTCFPSALNPQILNAILRGGMNKCREAGVALLGGHTVDDPEIKFGMAVTGLIHPDHIWSNAGARMGDVLLLTKPLGVGIITTAIKQGVASDESVDAAVTAMRTLNRAARDAAAGFDVHACTDVTGFSLMGHLSQVARASGVTARVHAGHLPLLPGAWELARRGVGPGGTDRNRAYYGEYVSLPSGADDALIRLLFDPQTSGGLLLSVPESQGEALVAALTDSGVLGVSIGEIMGLSSGGVQVS